MAAYRFQPCVRRKAGRIYRTRYRFSVNPDISLYAITGKRNNRMRQFALPYLAGALNRFAQRGAMLGTVRAAGTMVEEGGP
jgi:hypothetical protein